MTLIITALSETAIVQVSDRRLTNSRDGSILDDLAVKSLVVSCADAGFTMAYTGIAELGRKRTDIALADFLAAENAGSLDHIEIIELIRSYLSSETAKLRRFSFWHALTVTVAGFNINGPFVAMISNFEDAAGKQLSVIDDDFRVTLFRRSAQPLPKLALIVNGTEQAIRLVESAIEPVRKRYIDRNPKELSDALVQLIRKSTEHREFGQRIGKNCLSTVVMSNGSSECWDYRTPESPEQHIPHFISRGVVYRDIKIWTGPGVPSWWSEK
ncbi:MAG: hypothetical protein HY328_17565 [Chloroflexi bacterium]|nr:hypothetical protein [Chloroflexota bacterium]